MADNELRVDLNGYPLDLEDFANAVDLAAERETRTWLVDPEGKRIACLVPVDEAEESAARWDEFMGSMRSLVPVNAPADAAQKWRGDRRSADQHGEDRVS